MPGLLLELPGSTDKYTIEGLENGDDHHIYLRAVQGRFRLRFFGPV